MQDYYEPKVGDLAGNFRLPSTRGKEAKRPATTKKEKGKSKEKERDKDNPDDDQ